MYMKRVIILASGAGSNAENIINYFQNSTEISVVKVLCNKKEAGVFKRCKKLNKDCEWFSREDFFKKNNRKYNLIIHTAIEGGRRTKIDNPDIVFLLKLCHC